MAVQKLISGDEVDAIEDRRQHKALGRAGAAARVKRGLRRRDRHEARGELREALRHRDFLAV